MDDEDDIDKGLAVLGSGHALAHSLELHTPKSCSAQKARQPTVTQTSHRRRRPSAPIPDSET
jgi:hypothetical protein